MALKVVNTESLDAVANAINAKAGTSGAIQFPEGYIEAIEAIQAGGGEDLSTVLTEQEELVAELKGLLALKAKLGDAKLPSIIDRTVTEITAEDLAGVTKIGDRAFTSCANLVSAELPETVTKIGSYAFQLCSYLANIDLANAVTIMSYAYEYVGQYVKTDMPLTIKSNVLQVSQHAFSNSGITSVVFEGGGTEQCYLQSYLFYKCNRLKSAYIGARKNAPISDYMFNSCAALDDVTIENGVLGIMSSAFYNCTALQNIVLPSSIGYIQSYAFNGCKAMEYIDLTSFGTDKAFPTLSNVNAFKNCGTATASGRLEIRVPTGRASELADMTNWGALDCDIVEVS